MRFGLLGPVEVWHAGEKVPIERPRQRAVLAYLLLAAGRLVSTAGLIDAIWGGTPPSTAKAQIQADVSAIRRATRRAGAPDVVQTDHGGYRIPVERGALDIDEFTDVMARARTEWEQPQVAAALLGEALALWRGPALADAAAAYVEAARAGLEERRLGAHEDLADVELMLGHHTEVIARLTALSPEHRMRERPCTQLMTALYRAGRQADALAVARGVRKSLVDQHGLDPGAKVRQLESMILRADPALDALSAVRSGSAERAVPAQLPRAATDFVGRTDLLDRIDALVGSGRDGPAADVILVTGIGGVGKTAVTLRWAHRSRTRFPDGQLFVDMRGDSAASALPPLTALAQLLRSIGLQPDRVLLDLDEAGALYRTLLGGKRVLVVLDNCHSADQVRPMLPSTPGCVTLVTSRRQLSGLIARDGARRVTVTPLVAAESVELLSRIAGADRTGAERDATAVLADLCGHLPLALRIGATHLADRPHLRIADLVNVLRDGSRLDGLDIPGDGHASVRATFDFSYRALEPSARRLFRLLSLVPGGDFTSHAAAALLDTSVARTTSTLAQLVAAYLVDEPVPGRFAFHDLVRLHAQTRSVAEDGPQNRDAALRRLLACYVATAHSATGMLYPQMLRLPLPDEASPYQSALFSDNAAALSWLEVERSNLASAVLHAAEHGPRRLAWLLADALRGFYFARMYTVDWSTVARAALAAAGRDGDVLGQAAACMSLGGLNWRQGQHRDALRHHKRALTHARAAGWVEAEAATLGNLGTVYAELGQLEQAAEHQRLALNVNRRLGWMQGQAVNLVNLGLVQRASGRFEDAMAYCRQAHDLYLLLGSRGGAAIALTNLGEVCWATGELATARESLQQALVLHGEVGDRANEAEALRCLAAVERDAGRLAEALRLVERAVTLAREAGHSRFEIEALTTLASIRRRMGDQHGAVADWLRSLRRARSADNHLFEVEIMLDLADALNELNFPAEAAAHAEDALRLARMRGNQLLVDRAQTAVERVGRTAHSTP